MTSYEQELREYQPEALNKIKYWMKLYNANGSIIRQKYKDIFEYLLNYKATHIIIEIDERWLMKDKKILLHLSNPYSDDGGRAAVRHSNKVTRVVLPQIAEQDPVLSKYMKVIEKTEERVEIHFIYPDE